ncbi:MAG: aspartate/tyrosine/aromatic aminotransferase [Acidimicrobiales bacterium]|nr:aspartate/tyrosine/aromatic aminotransferase [Acidimicrobiales bacterium]
MKGPQFRDGDVPMALLRQRAFNQRWATLSAGTIALTAADADFPVAPAISAALASYGASGVYPYGPPEGLPEYRAACARLMTEQRAVPTAPDQILAVDGAAAGMAHVARTLLAPGDEAIVFDPVDYLFAAAVEAVGATVVRLPIDLRTGRFDPDRLDSLVTPRTRLLCLCNPHNPLGRVWTVEELTAFAAVAVRHQIPVLNDEVWSAIVFEPSRFVSLGSLGEEVAGLTWTVGGFSKSHGLAGLRVGFVAAPDVVGFERLAERSGCRTTMTGAATSSQVAAVAAIEQCDDHVAAFVSHLRRMRDLAVDRLSALPGVEVRSPEGTFALFPDVSSLGVPAEELARRLLENHAVAVVPGSSRWFGPGAEGHLRITFCTSEGLLRVGLDRISVGLMGAAAAPLLR